MIYTILFIVFCFVAMQLYEKWKWNHKEEIQAKRQAQFLEYWINEAKYNADKYNCPELFEKYADDLRNDYKAYIFSTDYGDLGKPFTLNWHNNKSCNALLGITFYYLSDTPSIMQQLNLDKKTVLEKFYALDLLQSPFTNPKSAQRSVLIRMNCFDSFEKLEKDK